MTANENDQPKLVIGKIADSAPLRCRFWQLIVPGAGS